MISDFLYDFLESQLKYGEDGLSVKNMEEVLTQISIEKKIAFNVFYEYFSENGYIKTGSKEVNIFEIMAFVYKKVSKIENKLDI